MRNLFALPVIALMLTSAPLAAQSSVRDFTLPRPSPTATPQVQGPVDDTGIVPVGPRVIPTESPSPRPTATPSTGPTASPTPRPTAAPATSTAPSQAQARPPATPTPRPPAPSSPSPQGSTQLPPTEPIAEPAPGSPLDSGISLPAPIATDTVRTATPALEGASPVETSILDRLRPYWIWILGALGLLAIAGIAGAIWRRRKSEAAPPEIEPPLVDGQAGPSSRTAAADEIRFDIRIDIESLSRSFRMVTVKYRVEIANRSARALRDISLSADLVSAARGASAADQLAGPSQELPQVGTIDRIGPHQSRGLTATAQLPVGSVEVFMQGQVPMFVPLLRLQIRGPDMGELTHTYALGLGGSVGGRVNPLPLNEPLGSYQGVRSVRVDPH